MRANRLERQPGWVGLHITHPHTIWALDIVNYVYVPLCQTVTGNKPWLIPTAYTLGLKANSRQHWSRQHWRQYLRPSHIWELVTWTAGVQRSQSLAEKQRTDEKRQPSSSSRQPLQLLQRRTLTKTADRVTCSTTETLDRPNFVYVVIMRLKSQWHNNHHHHHIRLINHLSTASITEHKTYTMVNDSKKQILMVITLKS